MNCKKCGGEMIGDGYTLVMHCEYAEDIKYEFHEPDADPVYCDYKEIVKRGFCPCCNRYKRIDNNGNMKKHKLHAGVLNRNPQPLCRGVGRRAKEK